MIRIMTADDPASTTITVAGKKPVRLHLRELSAIDESARQMLRHLAAKGVELTALGIYSSYIVDEIQSMSGKKRRHLC